MLSVLSPYLTGLKIAAVALFCLGDFYAGYHIRDLSAVHQQEVFTIAAQKQAAVYTEKAQAIANQVEVQNAVNEKKHSDELAYYGGLIAQHGGLYDLHSTTSRKVTPGAPGTSTATSGNGVPAASSGLLSEEATTFLLNQANLADQVVDQYLTCQKYIKDLGDIK